MEEGCAMPTGIETEAEGGEAAFASPSRAPPARGRRMAKHALRVVLGLGLGLALAEGAFWLRDDGAFPHLNLYVEDPELGARLAKGAAGRVRVATNPVTSVRINGEGYRGGAWPPASPDDVLVVGDSQVFGLGVEESETFAAVLQAELGRTVRNLGVPTYGPAEYNAVLREALAKRPAKVVIWVANLANDLFEASRPNRERHAIWDGWAVRKETAPASVTSFPGRDFLYRRSHGFYALRRLLRGRGATNPETADQGFESEGTWRDIGDAALSAERERAAAEQETAQLAALREIELRYAASKAEVAQRALENQVVRNHREIFGYEERDYDKPEALPKEDVYRAARLDPGDIVTVDYGESGRDVRINADHIRRGAALRRAVEEQARKRAEAKKDRATLDLFARRDDLETKLAALRAAPLQKAVASSPLAPAIAEAKTICGEHGARLLVVALPVDVQVSETEWAKYGAEPVDMEPTKVLLEDVVAAARGAGAEGLDATPALAAAEPGAFLDGDIHMTPKGHRALGAAIAKVLRAPPRPAPPGDGLPEGRSYPPSPTEWTPASEISVRESDPAGCETKVVREWLGVFCHKKPGARAVTVASGTEVTAGSVPGGALLIAPLVRGQDLRATFLYQGESRELTVTVPGGPESAAIAFSKATPAAAEPAAASQSSAFCTCVAEVTGSSECAKGRVLPDEDCARAYGGDCKKLIACASGDPRFEPACPDGRAPAGGSRRCRALCSDEVACSSGRCVAWQGGRVCM
jgi:hypothetical protein